MGDCCGEGVRVAAEENGFGCVKDEWKTVVGGGMATMGGTPKSCGRRLV